MTPTEHLDRIDGALHGIRDHSDAFSLSIVHRDILLNELLVIHAKSIEALVSVEALRMEIAILNHKAEKSLIGEKPNLFQYERELNKDGTEKHIHCDGARYHILSWSMDNAGNVTTRCSEPKCEVNKP